MIKDKVCYYLPGDMGGTMKKVTNNDIGEEGGGAKIWHFCGEVIFEWLLKELLATIKFKFKLICLTELSCTDDPGNETLFSLDLNLIRLQ